MERHRDSYKKEDCLHWLRRPFCINGSDDVAIVSYNATCHSTLEKISDEEEFSRVNSEVGSLQRSSELN